MAVCFINVYRIFQFFEIKIKKNQVTDYSARTLYFLRVSMILDSFFLNYVGEQHLF